MVRGDEDLGRCGLDVVAGVLQAVRELIELPEPMAPIWTSTSPRDCKAALISEAPGSPGLESRIVPQQREVSKGEEEGEGAVGSVCGVLGEVSCILPPGRVLRDNARVGRRNEGNSRIGRVGGPRPGVLVSDR